MFKLITVAVMLCCGAALLTPNFDVASGDRPSMGQNVSSDQVAIRRPTTHWVTTFDRVTDDPDTVPLGRNISWDFERKRMEAWAKDTPKIGDMAPDFTLKSVDGKTEFTLSELRKKSAVALIFGSFT